MTTLTRLKLNIAELKQAARDLDDCAEFIEVLEDIWTG